MLRDRQKILDCINAHGSGIDLLDSQLIREVYLDDAIDKHGLFLGVVDEFVPFAIDYEAEFVVTHHGITSHNCELDGDSAHAESYVYFLVLQPNIRTICSAAGRYIDRLQRRGRKWAIAVRRLLMDITFEVRSSAWLGNRWIELTGNRDRSDPSYQRPLEVPVRYA